MIAQVRHLLVIALLLTAGTATAGERTFTVVGRAVDATGKPIEGAVVLLWPVASPGAYDGQPSADWVEVQHSGPDGTFRYSADASAGTEFWRLYVTSNWPRDAEVVFEPPDNIQRAFGRKVGRQLRYRRDGVDVGDIQLQVVYHAVDLRLVDQDRRAFSQDDSDWVDVEIRNARGQRLIGYSRERHGVGDARSSFKLALPTGTWDIQIRCGDFVGHVDVTLSDTRTLTPVDLQMAPK
jgi:hypothetical protein